MDTNKTPEQLAQEVEAKRKAVEARDKFLGEVRTAINSASTDPNVRIVLRYVMTLAGYMMNPVALNSTNGDVAANATIYNAGRESVYHDLRKSMSAETRNAIERSE